jgi:hypothetical protein
VGSITAPSRAAAKEKGREGERENGM